MSVLEVIRRRRWSVVRAFPLLVLPLLAGCGDGKPHASSSVTEASIHGTVTRAGKIVKKGKITFDPANVNRPQAPATTADISPDGTYQLTTLVGENQIFIESTEFSKSPTGQRFTLPPVTVETGDNQQDFVVRSPGDIASP